MLTYLSPERQTLLYQDMDGDRIALAERYPPREPVADGHTILVAQLSEERQTLLEPSAYELLITLGNKKL